MDVQEEDKDSRKKAVAASLGGVVTADGTDERADEEVSNKSLNSFFPLLLHYKLIFTENSKMGNCFLYLTRCYNIDTYLPNDSLLSLWLQKRIRALMKGMAETEKDEVS